jgi:hypothetical protein
VGRRLGIEKRRTEDNGGNGEKHVGFLFCFLRFLSSREPRTANRELRTPMLIFRLKAEATRHRRCPRVYRSSMFFHRDTFRPL